MPSIDGTLLLTLAINTMVTASVLTFMGWIVRKLLIERLENVAHPKQLVEKVQEAVPFLPSPSVKQRPDWDEYFLGVARSVAERADCSRRKVGAVIVDTDHRIIATGYNGLPPGQGSCLGGDCPRGQHYEMFRDISWLDEEGNEELEEIAVCGSCVPKHSSFMSREDVPGWPCPYAAQPYSDYNTGSGLCKGVHAEANAIMWCRERMAGATIYVTCAPCEQCTAQIKGVGIERVVIPE